MRKRLALLWKSAAIILVMTIMAGCCSIICGTTQEVAFNSSPAGATVTVNGVSCGQTPVSLDLKRGRKQTIRIEMDGYQPYDIALSRGNNGWIFGNLLFGGIIGLVIDCVNGSIYTIKPDVIQANLLKDDSGTISVAVQAQPTGNLQKLGQMKKVPSSTAKILTELKSLRDAGVLTEAEYQLKRSKYESKPQAQPKAQPKAPPGEAQQKWSKEITEL
jgi:hypothetical protein